MSPKRKKPNMTNSPLPRSGKFMAAFLKEAIADKERQENAVWSKTPDADGFAICQPENLNKLFNKFVAENYKKLGFRVQV